MNHELDQERDRGKQHDAKEADGPVPGRRSASARMNSPEHPEPSGLVGVAAEIIAFAKTAYGWAADDAADAPRGAAEPTSAQTPDKQPSERKPDTEEDKREGKTAAPSASTTPAAAAAPAAPVQHKASTQVDAATTKQAAVGGVSGSASALPHLPVIQAAFGRHDVSHVRAYAGVEATQANESMGSLAYAMGDQVAFAGAPSLHTAAHEAAHVVQQRAGVHLAGGVGSAGDEHEQHADAVADAVVAGRSAEALLDRYAPTAAAETSVQHKLAAPPAFTPRQGLTDNVAAVPAAAQTFTAIDQLRGAGFEDMNASWASLQPKVQASNASLDAVLKRANNAHRTIEGQAKSDLVDVRGYITDVVAAAKSLQALKNDFALAEELVQISISLANKFAQETAKTKDEKEKATVEAEYKKKAAIAKDALGFVANIAKNFAKGASTDAWVKSGIDVVTLIGKYGIDWYYSEEAKGALQKVEAAIKSAQQQIQVANDEIVAHAKKAGELVSGKAQDVSEAANTFIKERMEQISAKLSAFATRKGGGDDVLQEIFALVEKHKVAVGPDAQRIGAAAPDALAVIGTIDAEALTTQVQADKFAIVDALRDEMSNLAPDNARVQVHVDANGVLGMLLMGPNNHLGTADAKVVLAHEAPAALQRYEAAERKLEWHQRTLKYAAALATWKKATEAEVTTMLTFVTSGQHMAIAKRAIEAANALAGMSTINWGNVKAKAF